MYVQVKNDMKKLTVKLLLVFLLVIIPMKPIHAAELTEAQKEKADILAEICTESWDDFGVLPSICIAQAFVESGLGSACYPNNLWGLHGGNKSYKSIESGTYAYLEVINNGYYNGALFETDEATAITCIVNGGYCSDGDYIGKVLSTINAYNLSEYNKEVLDKVNGVDTTEVEVKKNKVQELEYRNKVYYYYKINID